MGDGSCGAASAVLMGCGEASAPGMEKDGEAGAGGEEPTGSSATGAGSCAAGAVGCVAEGGAAAGGAAAGGAAAGRTGLEGRRGDLLRERRDRALPAPLDICTNHDGGDGGDR